MREKVFYVYKIICLCDEWNGKFYIGSHYGYVDDLYTGSGKKIKEYFRIYGKNRTYQKEILEISSNEICIKDKERELIRKNIDNDLCLNMNKCAPKSNVGKPSWNKGKSSGMKNKHHSKETRIKISEARKGRKFSEEHRQKLSKARKSRKFSEETKQKMSAVRRGKKHTEKHSQKISEARKGKIWINNNIQSKCIKPELLDQYLSEGWQLGMLKRKAAKQAA